MAIEGEVEGKFEQAMDFLRSRHVHINTRDERGTILPLDAETIIAIAELVRAYERTLVGPNSGPYVPQSSAKGGQ